MSTTEQQTQPADPAPASAPTPESSNGAALPSVDPQAALSSGLDAPLAHATGNGGDNAAGLAFDPDRLAESFRPSWELADEAPVNAQVQPSIIVEAQPIAAFAPAAATPARPVATPAYGAVVTGPRPAAEATGQHDIVLPVSQSSKTLVWGGVAIVALFAVGAGSLLLRGSMGGPSASTGSAAVAPAIPVVPVLPPAPVAPPVPSIPRMPVLPPVAALPAIPVAPVPAVPPGALPPPVPLPLPVPLPAPGLAPAPVAAPPVAPPAPVAPPPAPVAPPPAPPGAAAPRIAVVAPPVVTAPVVTAPVVAAPPARPATAAPVPAPAPARPVPEAARPAAPPPPPAVIRFRITTDPPAAMLAIDGERVENPFDRRTPPRPGVHRIEARMPGYQNATQTVTLEADRTVALRLAPLGAPPPPTPRVQPTPQPQTPPTQTPRAPRPPRQPRPRAGAGFVSDNPYE